MRPLLALVFLASAASPALAQAPASDTLRGRVVDPAGRPVAGANVFAAGSLDGAVTDRTGAFALAGLHPGAMEIVVQGIGLPIVRRRVVIPTDSLRIVLGEGVIALEGIVAEAGRHTAGAERGSTLTSLEVVAIPGARGDVARAFQTLPGVQTVDEGTGMFVRGGDAQETRVFLSGAALLDPQRVETPLGSTATTVDPFLLEGIFFSTGGFGARFGGALSAVADLNTTGIPSVGRRSTVHASLASVSGRTSHRVGERVGLHATANASDNRANFALNGATRRYAEAPHGRTLSGSAVWRYRDRGEARLFAFDRTSAFRVAGAQGGFDGESGQEQAHDLVILSWTDRGSAAGWSGSASWQRFAKDERFGSLDLASAHQLAQLSLGASREIGRGVVARGGVDLEKQDARFQGTLPAEMDRPDPALPSRALDREVGGARTAAWAEAEVRPAAALRVKTGLRGERSGWTGAWSWEPRLSATYLARGDVLFVLAAGEYSQTPDPWLFALSSETARIETPMRARQVVAGVSAGSAERMVRVEAYQKTYRGLAQLDRGYGVATGGVGRSRGADLFALATLPGETSGRLVYSLVDSERTDPNTGVLAPSAADVTHSLLAVLERTWKDRVSLGASYRAATGRPYTPVAGAAPQSGGGWEPVYGAPFSDRLPAFGRMDLSASLLHAFTPDALGVLYVSVYNVLGQRNVQRYTYPADYARRIPVPSQLGRGVFFGASITF